MVSALLMLRRVVRAVRHAMREEDFGPLITAGAVLLAIGTVSYAVGEDWNVVDALYFAVATLTTTSVADPELVLDHQVAEGLHDPLPADRDRDPGRGPAPVRSFIAVRAEDAKHSG